MSTVSRSSLLREAKTRRHISTTAFRILPPTPPHPLILPVPVLHLTFEAPETAAAATSASLRRVPSAPSPSPAPMPLIPTLPKDRPMRSRSRPSGPVPGRLAMALRAGTRSGSFRTKASASSLARDNSWSNCTASACRHAQDDN